jgi:predicted ATP-grasp superfamily ATP-dependent carboligase
MRRPSVLVLPVDNSVGLTVSRALGREGVPVVGVSFSPDGFGLRSRYLAGRHVLAGPPEARIDALLGLVEVLRPDFLMAHGEALLAGINARRGEFERFTRPLFATQDVLDRAFNKSRTLGFADRLGIPVPRMHTVESPADAARITEAISYPVVLKPPQRYQQPEHAHLNFSYRIIGDKTQLLEFLLPYADAPFYPLIQQYCPGHGVGIETCLYRGEPLAWFQHRRIREFPITGGPSVYRRSEPAEPRLVDWSLRLLHAMEWDGLAMVEFRYDPQSGDAVLMEVNGRFWGSLPLAVHSGVNFPHLLYLAHGLGTPRTIDRYRTGLYCRQITADTKWLWTVLRNGSGQPAPCGKLRALGQYLGAFFQCWHFDVEWPDDPAPALAFWARRLRLLH